jgi:hypothetical protein
MQEAVHTPVTSADELEARRGAVVQVEVIAYLALLVLALVLRLADLGSMPLMPAEAPQALAAWRVSTPMASGQSIVPPSALLFALQSMSFALLGGTEAAARVATVLAGVALVVSPALFRGLLGRGRALILSVVLLCSPVLLTVSRFSSPTVWSMLFAVLALWGVWEWSQTRKSLYAVLALVMGAGMIFLTEPGGPVLALIIVLAGLIARTTQQDNRFGFQEEPDAPTSLLTGLPLQTGLLVAALFVLVVATGFMLYPSGLSAVGETLAGAVRGFIQTNETPLMAFIVSVFYEPFMWLLGIATVILLVRRGELTFMERFLVVWTSLGMVASILFVGASSAHALWTTIPLTVLVSRLAMELLEVDMRPPFWDVPYWARGILALATLALLAICTLAVQSFARSLLESTDGTLNGVRLELSSVVLMVISVLFLILVSFMAVSLWNGRTALRGVGIGVLAFALITSLGSGWAASVAKGTDPLEPLHMETTSADVFLLRATLFDLADRETKGFSTMPLTVEAAQDSVLAWVVRDFVNARFIDDVNEARGETVVILSSAVVPDLGGDYVGQDFMIGESWRLQSLSPLDALAWWTQRKVGFNAANARNVTTAILWVRQDVYDGISPEQEFAG